MSTVARKILVAPSLLSCDFSRLAEEIAAVEKAGADWIHVDVMDGHFVDNLTLGPPVIKAIRRVSQAPLDVHLMIEEPERSLSSYVAAGADRITVHVEASAKPAACLEAITQAGKRSGITLRPATPVTALKPFLHLVDLVLVMTVNPGFGGQAFMPDQLEKIRWLRKWASEKNPSLHIEVDGGINDQTARLCRDAGADVFVAGSAVFRQKNYKKAIDAIRGTRS